MVNFKVLGVELLLIALFCVMTIGFVVTYVMAVNNDHVSPYFPYISDTGSNPPESCIFSLVCSIGAILVLIIVYIRHKHIHQYYLEVALVKYLNYFASILGAMCVIGLLLVGSFQDNQVVVVHFIGAFMVFGGGCFYEWIQLLISYKIYRSSLSRSQYIKCVLFLRLVFSSVGTLCFLATTVIGPAIKSSVRDTHFWTKDEKGYSVHLFSTVCEWIMSLMFMLYFLTFHIEFMKISVDISIKARYHHSDTMSDAINERTPLQ